MVDILTGWNTNAGYGDWSISPASASLWVDDAGVPIIDDLGQPIDAISDLAAGFSETGDLITAVLISLFTDAAASDDDIIPDGTADRRGWWGGDIGSKLWLRMRSKATPLVLAQVKDDIEQALAWLVTDGVASAVTVTTSFFAPTMLGAQVTISRNNAPNFALRFSRLWENI